jgi:hypothetical protein
MVHNTIWKEAGMTKGDEPGSQILCIGCLETRLGRTLTPGDFTNAPINNPRSWDTERLASRKGHR